MKHYFITALSILIYATTNAQKPTDLFGVEFGYSASNIRIKDIDVVNVKIGNVNFSNDDVFSGDGIYFGVNKNITNKINLALNYTSFRGADHNLIVNNLKMHHTIRGFILPITVNFLARKETRKLNFHVGAGVQYLSAQFYQYQDLTTNNITTTEQLRDIKISELGIAGSGGVQYRIIKNLIIDWSTRISIATSGRWSNSQILSLKYSFSNGNSDTVN